jgi:hypothetical protein
MFSNELVARNYDILINRHAVKIVKKYFLRNRFHVASKLLYGESCLRLFLYFV